MRGVGGSKRQTTDTQIIVASSLNDPLLSFLMGCRQWQVLAN
jgi:hypothetical protein